VNIYSYKQAKERDALNIFNLFYSNLKALDPINGAEITVSMPVG
jgi:hypothetical protein